MNCRPGDLAMYVGQGVSASDPQTGETVLLVRPGLIVQCVEVDAAGTWRVADQPLRAALASGDWLTTRLHGVHDTVLKPLRWSDDPDETLRWAGRPR